MRDLAELKFGCAHHKAEGVENIEVVEFTLGIEVATTPLLAFAVATNQASFTCPAPNAWRKMIGSSARGDLQK